MVPLGGILTQLWACRIIYSVTDPIHARPTFWTGVPLDTKPIDFDVYRFSHTILLMNHFSVSESSLRLKNPSEKNVAFKIKTTAPQRYFFDVTWLDLIWPFRYCVRPNASTVPPNGEAIIKVMLQPGGTDERHKFMVQSIYGKFWPSLTSNDPVQKLFDDSYPDFTQASAGRRRKFVVLAGPSPENIRFWSPDFTPISPFHPFIRRSKFWPHLNPYDHCSSVPDDYNQIEEKDEKKNFVNSLWADSANNPVMSSKLICVFQTENQQSKSEVKIYTVIIRLINFWPWFEVFPTITPRWYNFERLASTISVRKPPRPIHFIGVSMKNRPE